jgi:hypothetical protein
LESTNQSYEEAKKLLEAALASTINLQYEAIQQLIDIDLPYSKDPFLYIAEMRTLSEKFKELKIDTDLIFQYCIWRGLNDTFQNQVIQITNKNKPSLAEINASMYRATERYQVITKKYQDKKGKVNTNKNVNKNKSTNSMAANVKIPENKPKSENQTKNENSF